MCDKEFQAVCGSWFKCWFWANIAHGSDPAPVSATITDADSLLSQFGTNRLPYSVPTSSAIGQQMVNDANVLDRYNNGDLTPNCTP